MLLYRRLFDDIKYCCYKIIKRNCENMADNFQRRGRGRHPPHLKGRDIGMFYAARGKAKKQQNEIKNRLAVHMSASIEDSLSNVMETLSVKTFDNSYRIGANDFKSEYWNKSRPTAARSFHAVVNSDILNNQLYHSLNETSFLSSRDVKEKRHSLPAYDMRKRILKLVEDNPVIVVTGETGCGKTTQVPQYILDSFIESKRGSLCTIVCTQPRRISAISVAERVAYERGIPCGGSDVGYQIRLEEKLPRQQGSILYCTTGIVQMKMQHNPFLQGITHIIVDEVHERDIQTDFLLIQLKDILKVRSDLKIILMSATMNAEEFSTYFDKCPMIDIPGFTYPVKEYYLEDMIETLHYKPSGKSLKPQKKQFKKFKRGRTVEDDANRFDEEKFEMYLSEISHKYSPDTIQALRDWNRDNIDLDLIVEMLKNICNHCGEGAILVFLPGWANIKSLNTRITENSYFVPSKFLIIPLHSQMPSAMQREIFNKPPPGIRKIILSTNIAETSITIDDVVFVIDTGKIKMKNLDYKTKIQSLLPEWVSKSNSKQRRGRAGRTQPGVCYHMYTQYDESQLRAYPLPEILRTTLEELILSIKLMKLGPVMPFLAKAMTPPDVDIIRTSMRKLMRLNALTFEENLTPLGYHLARLPMDPQTGKMILLGAIFSCLDPILSIAASLSFKDAFMIPLGKEQLVDKVKVDLSRNAQSDHLMFANVVSLYDECKYRGTARSFCYENFLSESTLTMLINLKKQFVDYLVDLKFLNERNPHLHEYNRNSDNEMLLRAIVCAGLYPNVAKVSDKKPNRQRQKSLRATTEDGNGVQIHPKSVNAYEMNTHTGWCVYHLKLKSSAIYLHDSTFVTALSMIFFGGRLETGTNNGFETISVDDWIILQCSNRLANLVFQLREELDHLLEYKINYPSVSNFDINKKEGLLLNCLIDLIAAEVPLKVSDLMVDAQFEDDWR